jgi:hypothetical protein
VPDIGQRITLYRDGARYFTGWVTGRSPSFTGGSLSYSITVSGPWFHLEKTSISQEIPDQSDTEAERNAFIFPEGDLRVDIIGLITRAIALGMPIREGSVATCFAVPRMTLQEMSFAEAFGELMRWLPDGRIYVDYSGTDGEWPALCMQRRTPATTITLDPAEVCISRASLEPRHDLVVEEIKVLYADRATVDNRRVTVWQAQSSGSAGGPLPSRQLITVSGPEMDLWTPQDVTDSETIMTRSTETGNLVTILAALDTRVLATGKTDYHVGDPADGWTPDIKASATTIVDSYGNAPPTGYTHAIIAGQAKDWFSRAGVPWLSGRLSCTIWDTVTGHVTDHPQWAEILGMTFLYQSYGGSQRTIYYQTVSVGVQLLNQSFLAASVVIRPEDWSWYHPPAGLAANLLAAQDFLPMDGSVSVALRGDIPAGNPVGSALNIANFLPETAAMRAMISGCSVTPASGRMDYTLDAPDRHSFRDMVSRFRQSGADNIYWLAQPS